MANSTNLDLVSDVAGSITVGGVDHTVRDLDGQAYRELKAAEGTPAYIETAYATAARLVPTLTPGEVDRLSGKKVGMILAMADGRVVAVEDQFPNAPRPDGEIPTPPA